MRFYRSFLWFRAWTGLCAALGLVAACASSPAPTATQGPQQPASPPASQPGTGAAGEQLPPQLANDPVARALGAQVVNAALKEGKVVWYGGTTTEDFLKNGGKKAFEDRFGIKVEYLAGRLRELTDRIRTEVATGRVVVDVYEANDQYQIELHQLGALERFRPPNQEIDRIKKEVFVRQPEGYWWPLHVSAQALLINTNLVPRDQVPKSYLDLLDPKWRGKVAIRDPRSAAGGGWQFLQIYNHPKLGEAYIRKFKETVNPFILTGGSEEIRDAIVTGRFAIGFGGRAEMLVEAPKGSPIAYVVPEEGLAWTPSSISLIKGAPHPNAAKVLMTWLYEVPNLQLWSDHARPVPHPAVKPRIPEMSVSDYRLMDPIPVDQLANPNPFFKKMEEVFGIR